MHVMNENVLNKNNSLDSKISSNRTYLMGVAMLMVLLYHLFDWVHNPVGKFNIGYVGVDCFLFLSGYGLRHSFERNSIPHFLKNRIKRIYPIYFIAVCLTFLILPLDWTSSDFVNNLLTIGFYTDGGVNRYDWYVESLFTLYFLFPLFYLLSKSKYVGLLVVFVATVLVYRFFGFYWWYDCLIGRIPIFLYGIMFKSLSEKSFYVIGSISLLLYFPLYFYCSDFLASSMLVPAIILILLMVVHKLNPKVKNCMDFMGKYSLEIYIANLFVFWTFLTCDIPDDMRFLLYLAIQVVATYAIVKVNKVVQKMLA